MTTVDWVGAVGVALVAGVALVMLAIVSTETLKQWHRHVWKVLEVETLPTIGEEMAKAGYRYEGSAVSGLERIYARKVQVKRACSECHTEEILVVQP